MEIALHQTPENDNYGHNESEFGSRCIAGKTKMIALKSKAKIR